MEYPICQYCQGDWLIPYRKESPDQIKTIGYQEEMSGVWCDISFKNNPHTFNYPDDCKPVTINARILEKNGFVYSNSENHFRWIELKGFRSFIIMKYISDGIWAMTIKSKIGVCQMSIGYVHKLQQAIRLYEIDKKIQL